jgi:hypothetical protein
METKESIDMQIDSLGISGSPYLYKNWLKFLADTKISAPKFEVDGSNAFKPEKISGVTIPPVELYERDGRKNQNKAYIGWMIRTMA